MATLLRYLDPSRAETAFPPGTRVQLPHGSIVIDVRNEGGTLVVDCPFVRLSDKGRVAALRKCAEFNMHPLTLVQIRLDGDALNFHFECELETAHPDKVFDCLREVASCADHFDDLFVEKFAATSLSSSQVKPLSGEINAVAFKVFQDHIAESLAHLQYGETIHNETFRLDIAFIAFFRIADAIRPQGYLRSAISEMVQTLYSDMSAPMKIEKARKQLEDFQKIDQAKFSQSLYLGRFSVPFARVYEYGDVCKFVDHYYSYATQYKNSDQAINATSCMYSCFTLLLGRFRIPAGVEAFVRTALSEASGKPWTEEGLVTLFGAADALLNGSEGDFEAPQETADESLDAMALLRQMSQQMAGGDLAGQMAAQAQAAQKMAMEAMKNMQKMIGKKDSGDES